MSSACSLNSQWSITDDITLKSNMNICGALRDLVQFVQSHVGVIILVKLLVNLLVNLHEYFSRFLNCANGTKSGKASH